MYSQHNQYRVYSLLSLENSHGCCLSVILITTVLLAWWRNPQLWNSNWQLYFLHYSCLWRGKTPDTFLALPDTLRCFAKSNKSLAIAPHIHMHVCSDVSLITEKLKDRHQKKQKFFKIIQQPKLEMSRITSLTDFLWALAHSSVKKQQQL